MRTSPGGIDHKALSSRPGACSKAALSWPVASEASSTPAPMPSRNMPIPAHAYWYIVPTQGGSSRAHSCSASAAPAPYPGPPLSAAHAALTLRSSAYSST
jgi:hypothetical protein